MAASIASSVVACLKTFSSVIKQLQESNLRAAATVWEDELGRVRIWAANIGAHQTNQSSLDFRLRDASHVRDQILDLLNDLTARLDDAKEILEEIKSLEEGAEVDGDTDSDDALTDMEELQQAVASTIGSLFSMSMLVRKPAQRDLRIGSNQAEVKAFLPWACGHVRDKFPSADDFLVSRLADAISRRRIYLKYRERHAAKLKQGINKAFSENENREALSVLSETIATDAQEHLVGDDQISLSGVTQTSYASSLFSGAALRIPPPPEASRDGQAFECPVCFHIIKTDTVTSWNRHVLLDLQPYICLNAQCTTPQTLYTTRHQWLHHLRSAHSSISAGKEKDKPSISKCPLCDTQFVEILRLNKHISRHLQDLALFVLPSSLLDDDEETDTENEMHTRSLRARFSDLSSSSSLARKGVIGQEGLSDDIKVNKLTQHSAEDAEDDLEGNASLHDESSSVGPRSVGSADEITNTPISHRISKAKKGKKVYACEYPGCSKVFTRAEHRKRHEANHNSVPPHQCRIEGCHKPFQRADLLSRHMERQHDMLSAPPPANDSDNGKAQDMNFADLENLDILDNSDLDSFPRTDEADLLAGSTAGQNAVLPPLMDFGPANIDWLGKSESVFASPDGVRVDEASFPRNQKETLDKDLEMLKDPTLSRPNSGDLLDNSDVTIENIHSLGTNSEHRWTATPPQNVAEIFHKLSPQTSNTQNRIEPQEGEIKSSPSATYTQGLTWGEVSQEDDWASWGGLPSKKMTKKAKKKGKNAKASESASESAANNSPIATFDDDKLDDPPQIDFSFGDSTTKDTGSSGGFGSWGAGWGEKKTSDFDSSPDGDKAGYNPFSFTYAKAPPFHYEKHTGKYKNYTKPIWKEAADRDP